MNDFNSIYQKIYKEYGEELEELRRKAKYGIAVWCIGSVLLGIILSIITHKAGFIYISIIICVLYTFKSKNNKKYNNIFKENVVKTFVKEYCSTLEYIPKMGISKIVYNNAEFERFDRYYSEDLISGALDSGYKINMAEVETQVESTDSDGNTTYSTVFHGLFAQIEIDKTINANMKIRRNSFSLFDKKEKLEMDSGEFEKRFDVHSTNKIIAMQLLTSDVMQMLMDFYKSNKITPEITLKDNKLYVRFATGSIFEPKLIKKALDYDVLFRYYNIINFTLDLTERFLKNIKETEI